jgi:hypothetical protein
MKQFTRLQDVLDDGAAGGGAAGTVDGDAAAASAAPSTPFGSYYNENGLNREAMEALPESAAPMRSMLEKYGTEEALYGGIKNLQYLASQKSLQPLSADATDEQKHHHDTMAKEYFRVPDHAKDYGVVKPENIPDEMWDAEGTDALLGILHKHNASPELVQALAAHQVEGFEAEIAKAPEAEAARIAEINTELQGSFGNELPAVSADAMRGLASLGIEVPESGNLSDMKISYTDIVKAGQRMTQLIGEDAVSRGMSRDSSQNSAGSYRDQANAIKTDPSNSHYKDFTSEDPARQKVAQAEWYRLMNMAETLEKK